MCIQLLLLVVKHKKLQRSEDEAAQISLASRCGCRFVPARENQTQAEQSREEILIIIMIVVLKRKG